MRFGILLWQAAAMLCALPVSADEPPVTSKACGAKFRLIPAGSYTMGTATTDEYYHFSERPRQVIISKPFYLQTTEVTQKQWKKIMKGNPSRFKKCGANCPVENVSWISVQQFIRKLNKREKTSAYRLPTEAEWEYAARVGGRTDYPWGDEPDCGQANYGNSKSRVLNECAGTNPGRTKRVASYPPNAWGLHDLAGSVFEWVADAYTAYRPPMPAVDPTGPTGLRWEQLPPRGLRGGYWGSDSRAVRSAARHSLREREQYGREGSGTVGFRLVRDVPEDSSDYQPLAPEKVKAVRNYRRDTFFLTERVPIEKLLMPENVPAHRLLATGLSGTIIDINTNRSLEFEAFWEPPPDKFRIGEEVAVSYSSNYALAIEPFWQWGTFPARTENRGGGSMAAVFEVPDIADWFGIRVRIKSSYLESGWIYHYDRNLY